jgi:hypothetical protein
VREIVAARVVGKSDELPERIVLAVAQGIGERRELGIKEGIKRVTASNDRSPPWRTPLAKAEFSLTNRSCQSPFFKLTRYPPLTPGTKWEQCSSYVLEQESDMLKTFVEEAAALASIVLFVGMIAVWAQLLPQL